MRRAVLLLSLPPLLSLALAAAGPARGQTPCESAPTQQCVLDAALAAAKSAAADRRAHLLAEVALAMARTGRRDSASATFAEAFKIAREGPPHSRDSGSHQVVRQQARAGILPDALERARSIGNENYRAEALREVAEAQARAGERDAAMATARSLEKPGWSDAVLGVVAEILGERGDVAGALAALRATTGKSKWHDQYLMLTVAALAKAGQFQPARELAATISYEFNRAWPLAALGAAEASAGRDRDAAIDFAAAVTAARADDEPADRAEALGKIAQAQAKAGLRDPAIKTIDLALADWDKSRSIDATYAIAVAEAMVGRHARAVSMARRLGYDEERRINRRDDALEQVASAHAQMGHYREALLSARAIDEKERRTYTIAGIAAHQARAGRLDDAALTAREAFQLLGASGIVTHAAVEDVARAQALAGLFADALATVANHIRPSERSKTLIWIASDTRRAGRGADADKALREAMAALGGIASTEQRIDMLTRIAVALPK